MTDGRRRSTSSRCLVSTRAIRQTHKAALARLFPTSVVARAGGSTSKWRSTAKGATAKSPQVARFFQKPKTGGGRRVVPIPAEVVAALREHRRRQVERRLRLDGAWQNHDLFLTTATGGPLAPRNLVRRFKELAKVAGLPAIPFHGLRHSHATQLSRNNIPAKVVSERLGHASIAITLDTYSHVLPGMQATAVAAIDAALFGAASDLAAPAPFAAEN